MCIQHGIRGPTEKGKRYGGQAKSWKSNSGEPSMPGWNPRQHQLGHKGKHLMVQELAAWWLAAWYKTTTQHQLVSVLAVHATICSPPPTALMSLVARSHAARGAFFELVDLG